MTRVKITSRRGLTMMELVVVMAVLVALATLVVPLIGSNVDDARTKTTKANFAQIRDVMLGRYRADMKEVVLEPYLGQSITVARPLVLPRPGRWGLSSSNTPSGQPRPDAPQLRYLFVNPGVYTTGTGQGLAETTAPSFDPVSSKGWRGPYLMSGTGSYPNPTVSNFTRDYGEAGDPTVLDGWGNPIVIQVTSIAGITTVQLRSAGPNGILNDVDDLFMTLEQK